MAKLWRSHHRLRIDSDRIGVVAALLLALAWRPSIAQDARGALIEKLRAVRAVSTAAAEEAPKPAADGGAEAEKKDAAGSAPKARGVTPPEYAGPALPRELSGGQSQFELARQLFSEKGWARGLDILDRLLAEEMDAGKPSPKAEAEAGPAAGESGGPGLFRAINVLRARVAVGVRAAIPAAAKAEGEGAKPEGPPDPGNARAVHTDDGIHYASVDLAVRRSLLELPSEGLEFYRNAYEPPARKALETASAKPFEDSLADLDDVARRFPFTAAGLEALEALGSRALDLGHAGRAADAFLEAMRRRRAVEAVLPAAAPERQKSLTLLARAARALLQAGRENAAGGAIESIRRQHAEDILSVRGEPTRGADLDAAALFRKPEASEGAGHPWPCAMARPDHAALEIDTEALPPPGSRASWIHRFGEGASSRRDDALRIEAKAPLRQSQFFRAFPAAQAAAARDRVLVRSQGELVALDPESGKILWRTNLAALGGNASRAMTSPEQDLPNFQNLGGGSITIFRDLAIVIDFQSPAKYDQNGALSYDANALFAFDLTNGKLRWRLGGAEGFPAELRTLSFTAPPTPAGEDLLVAPATAGSGAYLVGLSGGGKMRWLEKLYNYNAGYLQQNRSAVSQGASVAVGGGLAVHAPGHGVVAGVDVEAGRLRWLARYRPEAPAGLYAAWTKTTWAPAHPAIAGERVIVAPFDGGQLLALELETGRTLWERTFDGEPLVFLGASRERAYVAGDRIEAVDLESGKTAAASEDFRSFAGRGFVARDRIYVPLEEELAVFETAGLKLVARVGFNDARIVGLKPANLALAVLPPEAPEAPAASRLLAVGSWGVALVQPQAESWEEIGRHGSLSFERARLLGAEGRYDEALAQCESLLLAARSESSIRDARKLLVDTAREAARRLKSPAPIARVLSRKEIELEPLARAALEIEWARFLEASAPAEAAALYRRLMARGESGETPLVLTPDGVLSRPSVYAAEALADLIRAGKAAPDAAEEGRARESLAELPPSPGALRQRLEELALERPHLGCAAEALARLVREAAAAGDALGAARGLERLFDVAPALGRSPEALAARDGYFDATSPAPRWPRELLDGLDAGERWRQVFWKGVDQGFLVETFPESKPLRRVLALRGGKLLVISLSGADAGSVALEGFPDVEQAKAGLQSHIEEPGQICVRGEDAVLFTAAGIYQLEMPMAAEAAPATPDAPPPAPSPAPAAAPEAPAEATAFSEEGISDDEVVESFVVDAAASGTTPASGAAPAGKESKDLPRPGWRQGIRHAIDNLFQNRQQFGWGMGTLSHVPGNLFPRFLLVPESDEGLALLPDGDLLSVDLRSGKVAYRIEEVRRAPLGEPLLLGKRLIATTAQPAGVVGYPIGPRAQGLAKRGLDFALSQGSSLFNAELVPGFAWVLDTPQGIEVLDAHERRPLWKEGRARAFPSLARVSGAEVWSVDPEGRLVSRSLRSGRERWSLPLPRNSMPIACFAAGGAGTAERAWWLFIAEDATMSRARSYTSFTQSGKRLLILKLDDKGRKLAERRIGEHGITFTGQRWLAGDVWLLAYNQAEKDDRWFSRLGRFDPAGGALEPLFEAPIAGKGTGQPPRLALVEDRDGKLMAALGNAEGFGLFRRARETPPEEKQPEEKPTAPATSAAPGAAVEDSDGAEAKKDG